MKCQRCGKDNPAEVHTCTPLALVLADELHRHGTVNEPNTCADELIRLHAENEALRAELKTAHLNYVGCMEDLKEAALTPGEPVASIYISPNGEREFDDWRVELPVGRNLLYTAPQPQRDDTALLRQALTALENSAVKHPDQIDGRNAAIAALKERLA